MSHPNGESVLYAEFVCNMPGPIPEDRAWLGEMMPGCRPRVFVPVEPGWERVGDNLLGPAHNDAVDSYGVYHCPLSSQP